MVWMNVQSVLLEELRLLWLEQMIAISVPKVGISRIQELPHA
jgi:hypothetical protein